MPLTSVDRLLLGHFSTKAESLAQLRQCGLPTPSVVPTLNGMADHHHRIPLFRPNHLHAVMAPAPPPAASLHWTVLPLSARDVCRPRGSARLARNYGRELFATEPGWYPRQLQSVRHARSCDWLGQVTRERDGTNGAADPEKLRLRAGRQSETWSLL